MKGIPDTPQPYPKMRLSTILVVGPRELPKADTVEVWFDAGSGSTGQRVIVPVARLTLSTLDRGNGVTALYEYESLSQPS
ncbi:hypothetical protein ACN28G_06370 [Micromonospora sp. WMMA1923]|uniref:hypothetical protein n=1 Tax=Micromonospora sp. WMMA1923 TaxID=3404125 RepID=UPI003B936CF7